MTNYEIIGKKGSANYGVKITKVLIIKNISSDYGAVKNLVDTCNRCDVDMDFFPDILENYLPDYTF